MAQIWQLDALANSQWLEDLNLFLARINNDIENHKISTIAHGSTSLTNLSSVQGATITEALNKLQMLINEHNSSTTAHDAEDLTYSGDIAGASKIKEALDILYDIVNNLSFTGSEHDALVTTALVDIESEDFGDAGNQTYLNGRLNKWEQRVKAIEYQIDEAKYSNLITTTASIFTLANSRKGQVSDVKISGRTVANLEVDGDCENTANFTLLGPCSIALDSTNKVFGSNSMQATANATGGFGARPTTLRKIDNTKYYFATAYIKNVDCDYVGLYVLKGSDLTSLKNSSLYTDTYFRRIGVKLSPTDLTGESEIGLYCRGQSSATGQKFNFDGLMINEITQDEYNNLTEEELMGKYQWHNGTKSTVCAKRIKSIGKNLCSVNEIEFSDGVTDVCRVTLIPNTQYTLSANIDATSATTGKYRIRIVKRDLTWYSLGSGVSAGNTGISQITFITPSNIDLDDVYIQTQPYDTPDSTKKTTTNIQLKEGNTVTSYEPYKEDTLYVYATDENGNLIKLNSLQNGVEDEIREVNGLYVLEKNTKETTLNGSLITEKFEEYLTNTETDVFTIYINISDFIDNVSDIKNSILENFTQTYAAGSSNTVWQTPYLYAMFHSGGNVYFRFSVPKGEITDTTLTGIQNYWNNNSKLLTYQLKPEAVKTYELVGVESLDTFDGQTTIIWEPVIRFEAIADSNGQIVIPHTEYPIEFIEKVQEKIVDGDSMSYIDANYSQVDSTTIGSLTYGKKYRVIYHYPSELMIGPEMILTYPINVAASLEDIQEIQSRLEKELGTVWLTLIPLADKELGMYMITEISTPATVTTEELGNKINEILSVWKGE